MYKISIITINLNNYYGLQKTTESVILQTYTNKEYIIIDGGSNDGSINLIHEQTAKIDYWLSEPDFGIYDAMNKGINFVKGEWVIFMNSGDTFNDINTLESIFNDNSFESTDIIYGNTLYKDSKVLLKAPIGIKKNFFFSNTLCHQSIFTNARAFKLIGNYNIKYKYIADREWLLRARIANLNFRYINVTISEWDANGISKDNSNLFIKEINTMRKLYFNIFEIIINFTLDKASQFINHFLS
jgi:glycosyltransferase involved in cell wall biosynthesis